MARRPGVRGVQSFGVTVVKRKQEFIAIRVVDTNQGITPVAVLESDALPGQSILQVCEFSCIE